MNRKDVIRTLTAIGVVLLLGCAFSSFSFSDDTRGYKSVDTSVAVAQIAADNVKSATIDDREQQLQLILKSPNSDTENSDKIITNFRPGDGATLVKQLHAKKASVATNVNEGNEGSILGWLLIYMLPALLLLGGLLALVAAFILALVAAKSRRT